MTKKVLLIALLLSVCASAQAEKPDVAEELGLPMSTSGGREVRVWLGGGMVRPYDLYRVFETGHGVSGEHIVWVEATYVEGSEGQEAGEDSETQKMRAVLREGLCKEAAAISNTPHYLFCRVALGPNIPWGVTFADLLPDQLWRLADKPVRNCGWSMTDGESVGIEILQGKRRHEVTYSNPEFCCPNVSCAIADHARDVVRHIR